MNSLKELRCDSCGHLLGKEMISNGFLEIKCRHCGFMNKWKWFGTDTLRNESKGIVDATSGHSLQASNTVGE